MDAKRQARQLALHCLSSSACVCVFLLVLLKIVAVDVSRDIQHPDILE